MKTAIVGERIILQRQGAGLSVHVLRDPGRVPLFFIQNDIYYIGIVIMMKKNTIRLNETQLKRIISESVKKVLREGAFDTLPHLTSKYDPARKDEYSGLDNLIAEIEPYYDRLANDTFFPNEKPVGNLNSLSAARKLCSKLNAFFEGDYLEIIRGGEHVIITGDDLDDYDSMYEFCNYSLRVKENTPYEIIDELRLISDALRGGYLPDTAARIKSQAEKDEEEQDREIRDKNGGLKVLGKIDLSKVDPKAMNKKRW